MQNSKYIKEIIKKKKVSHGNDIVIIYTGSKRISKVFLQIDCIVFCR